MKALAAVLLIAAPFGRAVADGRRPALTAVAAGEGRLVAGSTLGAFVSSDGGSSWRWICEEAIGTGGSWDPIYALSPSGALFVALPDALRVSRDGGCTFTSALPGEWFADLAIAADGTLFASTATTEKPNDVVVSRDDGRTFRRAGLHARSTYYRSLRVAPTDPSRVYVSGYRMPSLEPLLYRSDDGGATWLAIPFAWQGQSQLRVLAVSPWDPDLVFARIDGEPEDTLLRSEDGAISWTPVLTLRGNLVGPVALPDGSLVTGTHQAARESRDTGFTWTEPSAPRQLHCAGAGFLCEETRLVGATDRKEAFRLNGSGGALACPAGTPVAERCAKQPFCETYGCKAR